jgi:hypothetical protein
LSLSIVLEFIDIFILEQLSNISFAGVGDKNDDNDDKNDDGVDDNNVDDDDGNDIEDDDDDDAYDDDDDDAYDDDDDDKCDDDDDDVYDDDDDDKCDNDDDDKWDDDDDDEYDDDDDDEYDDDDDDEYDDDDADTLLMFMCSLTSFSFVLVTSLVSVFVSTSSYNSYPFNLQMNALRDLINPSFGSAISRCSFTDPKAFMIALLISSLGIVFDWFALYKIYARDTVTERLTPL